MCSLEFLVSTIGELVFSGADMVVGDEEKQGRSGLLKYLIRSDKATQRDLAKPTSGFAATRVFSCTGESLQLWCGINYAAH